MLVGYKDANLRGCIRLQHEEFASGDMRTVKVSACTQFVY